MVEYNSGFLDSVFHALADPTRRAMLQALAAGPCPVGALAEPFDMSLASASKHVKVLEAAGLIKRTVQGRTHICAIDTKALAEAGGWIDTTRRFWEVRLDTLESVLLEIEAANHG